jgi:RNA-directed DNA polymerase
MDMSFSLDDYRDLAEELGHSEEFIDLTTKYAARLRGHNLPVIFSTYHLCELAPFSFPMLIHILKERENHYKFYTIKKRNGGHRAILSPFQNFKRLQRVILHSILVNVPTHKNAFGFISQKNITQNAAIHVGADYILTVDLLKFFDCITEKRVAGLFKSLGYAPNLAVDLAKICTVKLPEAYVAEFEADEFAEYREIVSAADAVTPQGAPTSPAISNLVTGRLDKRLTKLAESLGCKYSRYADDLTFSGKYENLPHYTTLNLIVRSEGFRINKKKVKLTRKGIRQTVTGLVIDQEVFVNRKFKDEVEAHLYGCKTFGVIRHIEHRDIKHEFFKEWLLGKIMFINSVEPNTARKYLVKFNEIQWPW